MAILITAILFALIGIALGAGGIQLLMLGGSAYYLITGIGFIITAVLLYMRRSSALILYALIVIGSLIWAVWEVGLDWWQLGPRVGVVIVLGLWLLTPWIRKPLGFKSPTGARYAAGAAPLAIAVAISVLVAIIAMFTNSTDLEGRLPEEQVVAAPNLGGDVPPGEWHQYGRTPYGQRYSPLDQVNVENVDELEEVWRYQTGDVKLPEDVGETTYQVTPLKVGNSLYICTPHNWAIAINATTGEEQWKYDPHRPRQPYRARDRW